MNRKPITIEVDEEVFQPYTNNTKPRYLQSGMTDNLNSISVQNFVQSVWGLDPNYAQDILDHAANFRADWTTEYTQATDSKQTPVPLDLHQGFRKISSDLLKQICNTLSLDHQALDTQLWRGPGLVALRSGPPGPRANTTLDHSEHRMTGISIDGLRASLWYYDRSVGWRSNAFDFGIPEGVCDLGLALFALSRYNMQQCQPSEKRQSSDSTILSQYGFPFRKSVNMSGATDTVPTKNPSCKTIRVVASYRYKNICQSTSIEEFKRVFLDCMRAHYHAWNARKHHYEIDEHKLMIFQPATGTTTQYTGDSKPVSASSFGVFVDFDAPTPAISPEGNIQLGADPRHRVLTPMRFMALDILKDVNRAQRSSKSNSSHPSPLKKHLYRYDLESFYYFLIWACTHYDLRRNIRWKGSRSRRLSAWASRLVENVRLVKNTSCAGTIRDLKDHVLWEWENVWRNWVDPLVSMFSIGLLEVGRSHCENQTGVDFDTCGGRITFEKFMKAIGEDLSDFTPDSV